MLLSPRRALRSILLLAAGLAALQVHTIAGAAEITSRWVGGASGRWGQSTNWDPVGVPNNGGGNTYHVVIDGNPGQDVEVILDFAPVHIETLTVETGDLLTMSAPATLFIHGGLIDLDGTMQMNPLNTSLTRLFVSTQDAQVIGDGELRMLGQPGRCLLQIGSNLTLTLGDPGAGPGGGTVLSGSGVVQGGSNSTLRVLERIQSILQGVDFIFFNLDIDLEDLIEGLLGRLSIVDCAVSGSGSLTTGSDFVGVRTSTFDGTNGLTIQNADVQLFDDAAFQNMLIDMTTMGVNNLATATFEDVTVNQGTISGTAGSTARFRGDSLVQNAVMETVQVTLDDGRVVTTKAAFRDNTITGTPASMLEFAPGATGSFDQTTIQDLPITAGDGSEITANAVTMTRSTVSGTGNVNMTFRGDSLLTNAVMQSVDIRLEDGTIATTKVAMLQGTITGVDGTSIRVGPNGTIVTEGADLVGMTIEFADGSTGTIIDSSYRAGRMLGDPNSTTDQIIVQGTNSMDDVVVDNLGVRLNPPVVPEWGNTVITRSHIHGDQGNAVVRLPGDNTISDSTLIDVSGEVQDASTVTINNVFFDATTFSGTGTAQLRMQANANINNGTFDDIDIVLSGQPYLLTANGFVLLRDLDLTIDGQTSIQTDTGVTVQVESTNLAGVDQNALITGDDDVNLEFTRGRSSLDVNTNLQGSINTMNDADVETTAEVTAAVLSTMFPSRLTIGEFFVAVAGIAEGTGQFRCLGPVGLRMLAMELYLDARIKVALEETPQPGVPSLQVRDFLSFEMSDESRWEWDPGTVLVMTGGVGAEVGQWEGWARLEVGGTDLGTDPGNHTGDPAGFDNNFDLSILRIGPGAHAYLEDLVDNGNRNGPFGAGESLYVDTLEFADASGILNLNGVHLYYGQLIGDPAQIIDVPVSDCPTGFNVVFGNFISGTVDDLCSSNDQYVIVEQRPAYTPLLPLIRIDIDGQAAGDTASVLTITLETATTAIPTQPLQRLSGFNYDTSAFENLDERPTTLQDAVVVVFVDANASRFLRESTGEMRMRVEWFDPGNVFSPAWTTRTDQAAWAVQP